MNKKIKNIEDRVLNIIRETGDLVLEKWSDARIAVTKDKVDIATNIDQEAELFIKSKLKELTPEFGFLGEEFGFDNANDIFWIVDPIDGTKNFVKNSSIWVISVALMYKSKVIFGAVHMPTTGDMWHATKNYGSFHNNSPIKPSAVSDLTSAIAWIEMPTSKSTYKEKEFIINLINNVYRVRSIGVGALSLCFVAMGASDAYIDLSGSSKAVDWPGALLIAEESGCMSKYALKDDYSYGPGTLVSAPNLFDELYKLIENLYNS